MPPHADKIFVGSHDYCMYALNSENGEISWKYKTGGIIKCTPCATSSFVIFGKYFFNISQIWYMKQLLNNDLIIRSHHILHNVFSIGSYDQKLHCVSTSIGVPLWTCQVSKGSIFATPLVYPNDNSVFVVTLDGKVAKLLLPRKVCEDSEKYNWDDEAYKHPSDITEPSKIWEQTAEFPVFSTPIIFSVQENLVVAAVINVKGNVLIYDYTNSGQLLLTYSVNANVFCSPLLVQDIDQFGIPSSKSIVFGAQDKYLYKITISSIEILDTSLSEGKSKRAIITESNLNCVENWKVLHPDHVYATPCLVRANLKCSCKICLQHENMTSKEALQSNCLLHEVASSNAKGTSYHIMERTMPSNMRSFIASVSTDGTFHILCAKSGTLLKQHKLGNNIFSSPIIIDNKIVVGNRDNFLSCYQLKSTDI